MKEFILNEHAWYCDCSKNKDTHAAWMCSHNPDRFMFFLGNQFFLITFYKCMQRDYDLKKNLVEQCCEESKIFPIFEVNKSVDICKELKNFRIKNEALKTKIIQINYSYYNSAGKEFAITTEADYLDHICNQDIIDQNYREAKSFLIDKKYDFLLDQLENLYHHNKVYVLDRQEIFKTIDHVIKSIKQLTN